MLRTLTILMLITSLIPRFGGADLALFGSQQATMGMVDCGVPTEPESCCTLGDASSDYCPISGGTCRCNATPAPEPDPDPTPPLPRPERDSFSAVTNAPATLVRYLNQVAPQAARAMPARGRWEGLSHNRVQSILGIWRT